MQFKLRVKLGLNFYKTPASLGMEVPKTRLNTKWEVLEMVKGLKEKYPQYEFTVLVDHRWYDTEFQSW